jgi:catechol 2,3-dioxygenase-like lactoylglutathione lyase family enzyme
VKIKLTSVHVDDQEKALRFYTEVLGFVKKADFSQGPFRWLTVASPEDPDGTELQLALNDNPAAKAYQQAMFQQGQPATMFFTVVGASDHRIRHVHVQRGLPARRPRPQHVQAHPRDDGRQPGSQVLDRADIGAAESNPAFLDSVLCFAR